jgi:hypothetical protein
MTWLRSGGVLAMTDNAGECGSKDEKYCNHTVHVHCTEIVKRMACIVLDDSVALTLIL